jgi:hypothetical protein
MIGFTRQRNNIDKNFERKNNLKYNQVGFEFTFPSFVRNIKKIDFKLNRNDNAIATKNIIVYNISNEIINIKNEKFENNFVKFFNHNNLKLKNYFNFLKIDQLKSINNMFEKNIKKNNIVVNNKNITHDTVSNKIIKKKDKNSETNLFKIFTKIKLNGCRFCIFII